MTTLQVTIRALLGPREPEVGCDVCFERLDGFVDAVVAGAEPRGVDPQLEAHLRGCPVCHEEYESLCALVTDDAGGRA